MLFEKDIEYIIGQQENGDWITVVLPKDASSSTVGDAFLVLYEHSALNKVKLLTFDEWYGHYETGLSHIDRGLEVLH